MEGNTFVDGWLQETCQDALNSLVGLFGNEERYAQLGQFLPDVFGLLERCIVHTSNVLAKKGVLP